MYTCIVQQYKYCLIILFTNSYPALQDIIIQNLGIEKHSTQ